MAFDFLFLKNGSKGIPALGFLVLSAALVGCSSPSYRCPLDSDEKPDSPTACTSMQEALAGAKANTGGRNSVISDDKGQLLTSKNSRSSSEYAGNSVISRLALTQQEVGFKSAPVFEQPKVFQFWTPHQVDSQGVFHEGRQSWMATTGRWRAPGVEGSGYKPSISANTQPAGNPSSAQSSSATGAALRPSVPSDMLSAQYIPKEKIEQSFLLKKLLPHL